MTTSLRLLLDLLLLAAADAVPAGYAEADGVRALVLGEAEACAALVQQGAEGRLIPPAGFAEAPPAVAAACRACRPAALRLARVSLRDLVVNAVDPGGAVEEAGAVLRVTAGDGTDLAVVLFLPVEATLPPGALPGAPVLAIPGARGDQRLRLGAEEALAGRVRAALAQAEPLSGAPRAGRLRPETGGIAEGTGGEGLPVLRIGRLAIADVPEVLDAGAGNAVRARAERAADVVLALACRGTRPEAASARRSPDGGGAPAVAVEPVAPPAPATGVLVRRAWFDSPLPSGDARNDRFPVEEHVPPGEARAAIVVLPIWKGGVLLPERLVAAHLAARGYLAAIVPLPWQMRRSPPGVQSGDFTVSSDLPRTRRALLQAKADVRVVTDRLRALPEVRGGRVGVLGVSLGAHVAAVAYRDDPRYSAGVFVMAGGDPASIIWAGSSETRRMKAEIEAQGLGLDDLRGFFAPLDPAAQPEPPAWPGFPRWRGILMVNALHDLVVPRENAMRLHSALGEPTLVWVDADHYSIAAKMPEVFASVDRHLDAIFR